MGKARLDPAFDHVLEGDHPQHPVALGDHQRRRPPARHLFHQGVNLGRKLAAVGSNVTAQSIDRALADLPILNVDAAHPRLGGEGDKGGVQALDVALAQIKALLRQHYDAAPLWGLIRQRRQLCRIGQGLLVHALSR